MEGKRFEDAVGRCGWPIEIRQGDQGPAYARYGYIRNDGYHQIPAGCLIAQDLQNVLAAGRCLSATHGAQASVRGMGGAWATGQAAGVLGPALDGRGVARARGMPEARGR